MAIWGAAISATGEILHMDIQVIIKLADKTRTKPYISYRPLCIHGNCLLVWLGNIFFECASSAQGPAQRPKRYQPFIVWWNTRRVEDTAVVNSDFKVWPNFPSRYKYVRISLDEWRQEYGLRGPVNQLRYIFRLLLSHSICSFKKTKNFGDFLRDIYDLCARGCIAARLAHVEETNWLFCSCMYKGVMVHLCQGLLSMLSWYSISIPISIRPVSISIQKFNFHQKI